MSDEPRAGRSAGDHAGEPMTPRNASARRTCHRSWEWIRLVKKAIATTDCWRNGRPQILIVTPQNIGKEYENSNVSGTMGKGCAEKSQGLAAEYERIADQFGCYYLDANKVVQAAPNDIDHMHLTAQGHKELAAALDKKIREIFEK